MSNESVPTANQIKHQPGHRTTYGNLETRFWMPYIDCHGRQQSKPWVDRKVIYQATINGTEYGYWEWESGVRNRP